MKVRSQDLKAGMRVRTSIGSIVTIERVEVFGERKSPFSSGNGATAYFPACVLVLYVGAGKFGPRHESYTFNIDEEVEQVFEK